MKKISILIILLFSSTAFSQSWTELKETNITVGVNAYDIFTNGAGNHIIVNETNVLKYYKMDVNGNTIIDLNPPLENSAVTSPSISGDATKLYVVYRKGTENKIRAKYSSDGGLTWSYISELILTNAPSSIECVFSKNKLHITYQIGTIVYFNYYDNSTGNWLSQSQQVSGTYSASNPRITINNSGSIDTVYFTFHESEPRFIKWRRYIVGSGMGSLYSANTYSSDVLLNLGAAVDNKYLYTFFKNTTTQKISWFVVRIWNHDLIGQGNTTGTTATQNIFCTNTANNMPYTAAWNTARSPNGIYSMSMDGSVILLYDLIYNNPSQTAVDVVNLSASGNDIPVVWKDNLSNNKLRYKYYDDLPLVPQNLTVAWYNGHPRLTWNTNGEADMNTYKIWKYAEGSAMIAATITHNASYTTQSWIDNSVTYPGKFDPEIEYIYKVKAVDIGNHESDYSNQVSIVGTGGIWKSGDQNSENRVTINEYKLFSNYPNPFNPSTTISYSIKEDGIVTLKVYDILGKEIATLVNENKPAGNYEAEFNASSLPSGMYIYKIQSGSFIDVKKMLLTK
jgi:hypothetical protein